MPFEAGPGEPGPDPSTPEFLSWLCDELSEPLLPLFPDGFAVGSVLEPDGFEEAGS
jgi:hypothetical protein